MTYSIIIPVYHDPAVRKCLAAVRALTYPATDFEVIVVENGTKTDWIEGFVQQLGYQYIYSETAGSYHARNLGIQQAQGSVLAFIDSDCVVDPQWLVVLQQYLTDTTLAGVMGYTRSANPHNTIAGFEQRMYEANINNFTSAVALQRIDTRNFAMRRSLYEAIGGFNDALQFGGDMEFGARAHAAGFTLQYALTLTATHTNLENMGKLLRKRVVQNYHNMKLCHYHDTAFVKKYFPQLQRYQTGGKARLLYNVYVILYTCLRPVSQIVCLLLPDRLAYLYFKAMNVVAIRLGMLTAVLHLAI